MRKFYVFWIVMLAILAIPQKMMAEDVYLLTAESVNGTFGKYEVPSNHQFELVSGTTYKYEVRSCEGRQFYFRVGVDDQTSSYQLGPSNGQDMELNINDFGKTSDGDQAIEVNDKAWFVTFDTNTYDYLNVYVNIADDSRRVWVDGHKKSSGGGGETPMENPLNGRTLTEGYYLVGNFFAYDGSTINYDAPVFKFQQQSEKEFAVELPATLDAHAQILCVNKLGVVTAVYGPGSVYAIDNAHPTNMQKVEGVLTANPKDNLEAENNNYWNMSTRRTQENGEGQDGSYWITLKLDENGVPSAWGIKHNDNKRIAYFISANNNGTALAISSIRKSDTENFNSGKYFGTLYMTAGSSYYAISNDMAKNGNIESNYVYSDYKVIKNSIDRPTYNKLFLWGNGNQSLSASQNATKITPNNGAFLGYISDGNYTLEFNSNKGNGTLESTHGGMSAEIINHQIGSVNINSVSMAGPAIPGTMNGDKINWASTAADMVWNANENCYKLSLVTSAEDGEKKFRFVGNHSEYINWYENGTNEADKARTPYNDESKTGHSATVGDPNEVAYTTSNENSGEDYHIIWNRPAGNWTVRFYIYTYTDESNNPALRYFYTINENTTLELRDLGDVKYKGTERNILLRGDYRYFRTWSGKKAWVRPNGVDVFVVTKGDGNSYFKLKKINNFSTEEDVIPATTGVILAMKDADEVQQEGEFVKAPTETSYNLFRIPMEQAKNPSLSYEEGDNLLRTCVTAQNVPTSRPSATANGEDEYNYLFGFYRATAGDPSNKAYPETYQTNDFLMGFWISNGNGAYYSNSAYLPVEKSLADKIGLGESHNDYDVTTGAKKMPAVLFDFADVDNTVTGISDVVTSESKSQDEGYYTLSGQRISLPVAGGIYIHQGKKYVVK